MAIYNSDCREYAGGQHHVLLTDPPYSAHVHGNAVSQSKKWGVRVRDFGFESLSDELREFTASVVAATPRWSLVYSDIESLAAWRRSCIDVGAQYIRPIPWVRWSMPQLSGDRPPTGCEFVTCYWGNVKGRKSWNGPGNLTHLAHKCLRGEGKHRAEKPLDQVLDLVAWFSNPGETVLDLFAGAGTVGLACKLLGREYIGYEIDPVWAERAHSRITSPLSKRDEERLRRYEAASSNRYDPKTLPPSNQEYARVG